MIDVKREITKEEYEKALKEGAYSLIPNYIIAGYGAYGAKVSKEDDRYILSYSRGESCD